MSTAIRPRATFGTSRKSTPGVVERSQTMYNAITENIGQFPSLPIQMPAFLVLLTALATAQGIVKGTKATGAAQVRNSKRNAVWTAMVSLQSYVQGLCDSLSVADAETLIKAAGMVVAKDSAHAKLPLTATLTSVPGNVHLAAVRAGLVGTTHARRKAMFCWEMSVDGKTWTALPTTPLASTLVTGLTLLSTYWFRVSVTVSSTPGTWSQAVSILVH
jgi:hypothetical protein